MSITLYSLLSGNPSENLRLQLLVSGGERAEDDQGAVLGVEEHEHGGGVDVGGREVEGEALEEDGDGELGLKDGQFLADARAGAEAEGEERGRVPGGGRCAVCEPLGEERRHVIPPQLGVVVQAHDGN